MDEYVIWDYTKPGISFNIVSGRITVFKATLEAMSQVAEASRRVGVGHTEGPVEEPTNGPTEAPAEHVSTFT